MATALDQLPAQTPAAANTRSILSASLFGAAVLIVGFAALSFLVPYLWDSAIAKVLGNTGFLNSFLRVCVLGAAAVGVVVALQKLLPNPPVGTRAGIFIVISLLLGLFFVLRAIGLNMQDFGMVGMVIFGVLAGLLVFGSFKFLTSKRFTNWSTTLENQGLFHTHSFKKTQGLRTRRWTMIALLFLGFSGIYALINSASLPNGDWLASIPFLRNESGANQTVRLLPDVRYLLPIIFGFATVWFAWRAVNLTTFGDFLIGTDAEMNKVSWSTWKKLAQDTIVVLVTTALLTAFLLVIDLFWGWLLTDIVKVLPQPPQQKGEVQSQKLDY